MRRRSILVCFLILLFCLSTMKFNNIRVNASEDFRVHNRNTGLDYATIQEAIDAPETLNGHTILVEEGIYFEHVIVGKSLTLLGEERETTVIDGNMIGSVVRITQDHVKIIGFTVQRSGRAFSNSGIHVGSTQHCDISGNCIADNEFGVFGFPRNMSIADNTVEGNFLGVALDSGATSNVISRNHLVANHVGVHLNLADANYILQNNMTNNSRSVTLWDSKNNRLYHNNFLNNTVGSFTFANFLDNGFEGNFWSDYIGVDLNHDGIGDSPYVIDANNTDHYPLMGMFNSFNVTYFTPPIETHFCNVTVISNSTISDFDAPVWIEHPEVIFLQFDVSGEEGSIGFCRVSVPTAMMNGTYHVSVNGTDIPFTLLTCSDANTSYLYFTYKHSTVTVIIIPESPAFPIRPLFIIATFIAVIAYKKKCVSRND